MERTSLVLTTAPEKKAKVRIPRKKGKPVTPEAIAKYLKIKALYESAKAIGNEGEAKAAKARLAGMEETYPGISEKAKKGAPRAAKATARPSYTSEASEEKLSSVSKKAAKAAVKLRKHKIVVTMPDGSTFEAPGYATRRAANIDAKQMILKVKKVFERELGVLPGRLPVATEYDQNHEESGYRWGDVLGKPSEALRRNPRRLRHNTHLPVGTAVDYKGKAAKVIEQHERDVYTVRFASTGKTMRVPGFLLERR